MPRPRSSYLRGLIVCAALAASNVHAQSQDLTYFTGITRLACEALLCLSSSAGGATSACNPALSHFYGIKEKYLSDTIAARLSFLQQCPVSAQTPEMQTLTDSMAKGAGRCDAESLNRVLGSLSMDGKGRQWVTISDKLPAYCSAYVQHELTDLVQTTPVYVGTVEEGGYWVAPKDYETELIKYQEALEERKKEEENYWRNHSSW